MSGESERPEVIARGDGVLGEIALRRRGVAADVIGDGGRRARGDVYELIINGVFLMDTAETSTEDMLAQAILDHHVAPRRVLVGGLGLGFTTAALLRDPRVERVDVVEIEPLLVDWLRAGLVPDATAVLHDPRVEVQVADARDALAGADPVYDAILLDVDNGPDFLVSERNAPLYEPPALAAAVAALTSTGMLAVWSSHRSPQLRAALETVCDSCDETPVEITRDGSPVTYFLYSGKQSAEVTR